MGKASFVAIAAMALLTASLSVSAVTSALSTTDARARDQQSLEAEEIARSGLGMSIARVTRDFGGWRAGFGETALGAGTFVTSVEGPALGPVRVRSTGVVDEVDVELSAWLIRLASASAALTVASDSATVRMAGTSEASGIDHDPDAGEGFGHADRVRGVFATRPSTATAFAAAVGGTPSRVRGLAPSGDLQVAALPGEHVGPLAEAVAAATDHFVTDQTFVGRLFGSLDAPAIVVVDGAASFSGGGGVGLLYVKGDFTATSDFEWRGVVVVEGEGDLAFTMAGTAAIYGAAYTLHAQATGVAGPTTPSPQLNDVPSASGNTLRRSTVAWPGLGTVEVTTQFGGSGSYYATASRVGRSLQSFLGLANLNGRDLGATGISNVTYSGPTQLPMLDLRPAVRTSSSTSEVTLALSASLPGTPLYLYIADLDWATMTLTAYDADGARLPTTSWTKSLSIDLILPDDSKRTTLSTGSVNARLIPNNQRDGEIIIDEIEIPDASAIRSLKFEWQTGAGKGDVIGLSMTTRSVYSDVGILDLDLSGQAAVRYASSEIGRLAAVLSSIEERAWIETYDFRMDTGVDRMTLRRRTQSGPREVVLDDDSGSGDSGDSSGDSGGRSGDSGGSSGDSGGRSGDSGGSSGDSGGRSGDSGGSSGDSGGRSGDSGGSSGGSSGDSGGRSGDSGGSSGDSGGRSGDSGGSSGDSGDSGGSSDDDDSRDDGSDDNSDDDSGSVITPAPPAYDYVYCSRGVTEGTNSYWTYFWARVFGATDGPCR